MSEPLSAVIRFLRELRRRHVFRVGAAYAVVAWVVVQVSHTVSPHLDLPSWWVTLVIVLASLGFPVALVLAWAYDITPDGVQRASAAGDVSADTGAARVSRDAGPGEVRDEVDTGEVRDEAGPGVASADRARPAVPKPAPAASRATDDLDRTRLIVLPFRMLRPDAETDFLSFSLPDAISSSLSGLRSLVVRSHLAAMRYADGWDLERIGRESDVDVVLSGTLLRGGERLRVSVQLTEVADGTLLWTQHSEVSIGDLFQLQDQLTQRIVESLDLPLSAREREALSRDVPATPRAYEYYLRANRVAYEVGQWSLARDLYLQSLEEDPDFAPALARLARCYRVIAKWSTDDDEEYRENLEASEAMFQRALEANPDLPIAHNLYAGLEVELGRAEDAMVRLLRQARAGGGDAELFSGLVHVLRFCGLLEWSAAAHRRARRLDPRVTTSVAHTRFMLGEYEGVLEETFGDIGYIEPLALTALGREEVALRLVRKNEEVAKDAGLRAYLTSLRALLEGDRRESVEAMDYIARTLRDPEALFYMVRQYARLDEVDRAGSLFERIVEGGFFCFPFMATDPWLESVRPDPRFRRSLEVAEERHRRAREAFAREGGEAVLGEPGSAPEGASGSASEGASSRSASTRTR